MKSLSHIARVSALALLVAIAVVAAPGCGKTVIDDVKTEETLKQEIEDSQGQKVTSVDCPSGVEVEPKTSFNCTIKMAKGEDQTAVLRIENEDADVSVVELRSGDVDLGLGG
jgi:hypothetical protein